ncbi:HET-domain-containing protein [Cadophora sp. DSE1049]|nr:HET-domain-containing protein [Cadophora sp. DSE1049]
MPRHKISEFFSSHKIFRSPKHRQLVESVPTSSKIPQWTDPHQFEPYVYTPLDLGRQFTRIVELLPSQGYEGSMVRCRLHPVSYDQPHAYEALSYHWGDANVTFPIILNGRPFGVTKNLLEALECLSFIDKPRLLWVDALSIDQSHLEERSFQVRGMARIYENAERVLIWLGLGNPGVLSAFRRLNQENDYRARLVQELEDLRNARLGVLTQHREEKTSTHRQIYGGDDSDSDPEELPILQRPQMGQPEASNEEISAIDSIFQHHWWDRVWVIQEATLATDLLVIYPTSMRSPWDLSAFKASLNEQKLEPLRRLNSIRREWRVIDEPQTEISVFHILDLIEIFRSSKATDARDKIYALVGLAQDGSQIELDYSATTQDVYTKVTKTALEGQFTFSGAQLVLPDGTREQLSNRDGTLRFLHHCLPPSGSSNLPSWVPDWTVSSGYTSIREELDSLANVDLDVRLAPYSTDVSRWNGYIQSDAEPFALTVNGSEVDQIVTVGQIMRLSRSFMRAIFDAYLIQQSVSGTGSREARIAPVTRNERLDAVNNMDVVAATWKSIADNERVPAALRAFVAPLFELDFADLYSDRGPGDMDMNSDAVIYDRSLRTFLRILYEGNDEKRYFVTRSGKFGLGRTDVQVGDSVCVLLGGRDPYILRKIKDHHVFVGNCFCDGTVLGDVLDEFEAGRGVKTFVLH